MQVWLANGLCGVLIILVRIVRSLLGLGFRVIILVRIVRSLLP